MGVCYYRYFFVCLAKKKVEVASTRLMRILCGTPTSSPFFCSRAPKAIETEPYVILVNESQDYYQNLV